MDLNERYGVAEDDDDRLFKSRFMAERQTRYMVPALDNTKAQTDDDLDLAVSKLVRASHLPLRPFPCFLRLLFLLYLWQSELLEGGPSLLLASDDEDEDVGRNMFSDDLVSEISKRLSGSVYEQAPAPPTVKKQSTAHISEEQRKRVVSHLYNFLLLMACSVTLVPVTVW